MKWSDVDNSEEYALLDKALAEKGLIDLYGGLLRLHKKMTHIYGKVACTECGQAWPCNTIRLLNGDTNE